MSKKNKDARSHDPKTQEVIRFLAVKATRVGKTQKEAAKLYGVSRQQVNTWVKIAKEKGLKGLKSKKRGRQKGDGRKLKGWQCALTVRLITVRNPDQMELPFYLWTREAVRDLIKSRFGITYSLQHISRLLKKWGFTVQKPARKASEQSSEAVRKWVDEEYPKLKARAKSEKGEILWGDEMGARSDAAPAKCYAKKGQTPTIKMTGKRFGCNMISAISNQGRLHFMVFRRSFTAAVFQIFLERLLKQISHKIFLIVDRHRVHTSKAIEKFLEDKKDRIELAFLPAYSPDLNPDELLNNDVKTNAVRRQRADNITDLLANVRSYLFARQRQPQIIMNFFKAKQAQYAA